MLQLGFTPSKTMMDTPQYPLHLGSTPQVLLFERCLLNTSLGVIVLHLITKDQA